MIKKLKESIDPKYFKICLYAAATVVVVAVILAILYFSGGFWTKLWKLFKAVLSPIILGGIICYLMMPLVQFCEQKIFKAQGRSWERPASVALSFLAVIAVITLILLAVIITVNKSITNIDFEYIKNFVASVQVEFSSVIDSIEQKVSEMGLPVSKIGTFVSSLVGGVVDVATGLVFGVIFSIYFLLDGNRIFSYWKRAFVLTAGETAEEKLMAFASDADKAFSGYIRGQFLDGLITGTVSAIVFLIIGVPSAIVVGILIAIGNLIPYVGPLMGYVGLITVCLLEGEVNKLIIGAICLVIIMFLDGNVLNPKLLSSSVKVHPLLVVAALIGGGALGGLLGMIVAVPCAALLKLQFDRYLQRKEEIKQIGEVGGEEC